MSAEWFRLATGIQAAHIPFKGSAPSILAVAQGEVDFNAENLGPALPMVQQGRVRLLAVAAQQRHPQEPSVPTFKEAGLPDVNLSTWIFLMAPAATPDAVVQQLNRATNDILRTDDMRDRLLQHGFVRTGGSIPEMNARMKAEADLWGAVIKNANIKIE
jgi:tripartite-type tricarboxylate transporter receptor subunit TctC